jgi:PKD repeat protein
LITYNTSGNYDVTLVAMNSAGSGTKSVPDYITVTGGNITYCSSHSNSNALDWIAKIEISSFSNPSGPSFYSDFTTKTVSLTSGSSIPITVTPGFSNKSQSEYWRIWIDINADGDFTDAGEQVFAANNKRSAFTGLLTTPSTASGQTRMRISMKNGSAPTPCEMFSNGEVEDYTASFIGGYKIVASSSGLAVRIWPNPANIFLNLEISGNTSAVTARIINIMGIVIKEFTLETGMKQIDLGNYPKGMYLIRITDGEQSITNKFVRN